MKYIFGSFITAFSMYSKIPVPNVKWEESYRRYAICFFPLVGMVTGLLIFGWGRLAAAAGTGSILRSAVFVLIPAAVTGGIHLDGFLDTVDALSSWQNRERKLDIMKDPHTGAFAVIYCCGYFLLSFGLWSELGEGQVMVLSAGFMFSRALSGLAVVSFPKAKKDGSLADFARVSHVKKTAAAMGVYLAAAAAFMLWSDWKTGGAVLLAAFLIFIWYYGMCKKVFGGTTGDLAGFFLQLCELGMAAAAVLAGGIK